ncbi:hypothetical protein HPB47_016553, partial [Ixodes persulcatus]
VTDKGVRFPEKSFSHFLDLLGKTRDNPTGGVLFRHPEGMTFSPEELLGMILSYAKDLASTAAGQPIKDAVVTVPAYFNQAERRALARAVSLAGLKLLQLLGDNTAVALNYGVFRRKEFNDTPTNILFYDMGTGSTTATIVSYQTVKSKEKGLSETVPQLSVKGIGLNADEAAALGAAYQAAYLSKGFKVKVFHVKEANVFPIQVDFSREVDTDGVKSTKLVRRVLFYRNNLYPQKKVMTFSRYTTDFEFSINYGDLSFMSKEELSHFGSLNISTVSLSGVADALKKHTEGVEPKGIKAHFKLDESGLLTLDSVEAAFEKTVEEVVPPPAENLESTLSRLGSTLGKLFSSGTEEPPKADSEGAPKGNQEQAEASQDQKADDAKDKESKAEARADGEKTETEGKSGDKVWQAEQEALQKETPLHETPKLTLKMIFEKIQLLDRETKYLVNKAQRAPPKKEPVKEEKPKVEPGLSVLDEASNLNFDIARGDEEEEALAEVRKKAEELQEAVENGFDDLLGLSDDEDEDLSTDQFFKPPHMGYGVTTSTPNVQAQMGYGITTSTPNTQAQNYTRPHFTTPGYIMSPHAHGNGVALHEPAARDFANGMGTPFQSSDEYGQDAVDSYCGGGDVGNKAPAVPFNLPAAQQLPQEPAPHQSDDYIQLQVMYKARLREVEKLSSELESLKQSSRVEISSLNAQLASLQAQEKLLADNFNQARQALAEKASETTSLSVKVVTLESQLEIETKLNQEMAEVQTCKERTSEREKWFEAQLLEKASVINQLTESLNKSQKQCQLFLEN